MERNDRGTMRKFRHQIVLCLFLFSSFYRVRWSVVSFYLALALIHISYFIEARLMVAISCINESGISIAHQYGIKILATCGDAATESSMMSFAGFGLLAVYDRECESTSYSRIIRILAISGLILVAVSGNLPLIHFWRSRRSCELPIRSYKRDLRSDLR